MPSETNVPLIGQSTTTSADPALASLSDEEREQLAAMAEEHPEDVDEFIPVATAFFVLVGRDGQVQVTPDVTVKVAPDRMATAEDIVAFGTVAVSQANTANIAQATAFQMAQVGRLMQQQAEEQRIRSKMAANQAKGFNNL